jgi:UPF0755 protein
MLEDLDLAWEEDQPRRPRRGGPPSRQMRQRRRKEKKRRRRSFFALFMSLVLLVTLGGAVYWGVGKAMDYFGTPDYTSNPATTPVNVTVNDGDSASQIAVELYNKKVVKSTKAFIQAANAEADKSKNIQPGVYRLFEQMPASAALQMLLDPDKNMLVNKVTIPEGMITVDIYAKLAKASGLPLKDFTDAAQDPVALGVDASWFTTKREDGRAPLKSVEGFLFPATYSFMPGETAKQMLADMVKQFNKVVSDTNFISLATNNLHITPYEALIAASIAQAEAVNKDDFAKVAKVLYNRSYSGNFPCSCLGLDSEVNYWLRLQGQQVAASEHLTAAQLNDANDPYNTHNKPGLPPGAISNPGQDALQGAVAPVGAANVFYFMTVDKQGTMAYATNKADHERNIQTACRNGIPLC